MSKLFCKIGKLKGLSFDIDQKAVIGRSDKSDLVVPHPSVSSRHARIYHDSDRGCFMIEDLNSLNGTSLDGVRITEPESLNYLHVINFGGEVDFFFHDPARYTRVTGRAAVGQSPPEASDTQGGAGAVQIPSLIKEMSTAPIPPGEAPKPQRDTLGADGPVVLPPELAGKLPPPETVEPDRPKPQKEQPLDKPKKSGSGLQEASPMFWFRLDVLGFDKDLKFEIHQGENIIGRVEGAAIRIPHHEVSREHAVLTLDGQSLRLKDLGSTNGTYVDHQPIETEVEVGPGQILSFGKVETRLEARPDTRAMKRSNS